MENIESDDLKITTGQGTPPVSGESPAPPGEAGPPPGVLPSEELEPSAVPPGAGEAGKGGGFIKILKTLMVVVIIAVIVGGVGAIGYYVIFPLVFPPGEPAAVKPPVSTEKVTHKTYLVLPPAAESEVDLTNRSYAAITVALQNEAFAQLADGQLKELKISDSNGQVPFAGYIAAVAPSSGALDLKNWFEGDFTALLYYNPAGVWPMYIGRLKSGVDPAVVMSGFNSLENVLEIGNFYFISPGSFAGFKDGKYSGSATRYNIGTQLGASFNYGIFGQYLVVATNFDGLKATLSLLGL